MRIHQRIHPTSGFEDVPAGIMVSTGITIGIGICEKGGGGGGQAADAGAGGGARG